MEAVLVGQRLDEHFSTARGRVDHVSLTQKLFGFHNIYSLHCAGGSPVVL